MDVPGLPVPISSYDLCGRNSTLNFNSLDVDVPGFPVPNSSYDLCGRKAKLNFNSLEVDVLGSLSLIVLTISVDVKQN